MSTTRSQKRKNIQREVDDNVSEGFVSPINMENSQPLDQNAELAGPSKPKSPRVENGILESMRSSLKEEITSEIKTLLLESQREMLKLLRSETRENVRDHVPEELENETRSFYTPTKTVRNNSTQNEDHSIIRNNKKAKKADNRAKNQNYILIVFSMKKLFFQCNKTDLGLDLFEDVSIFVVWLGRFAAFAK